MYYYILYYIDYIYVYVTTAESFAPAVNADCASVGRR